MRDYNGNNGVGGDTNILSFQDRGTKFRAAVAVNGLTEEDTTDALRFIKGSDEWNILYADDYGGYKAASYKVGAAFQPCQPGVHHSNGLIENANLQLEYDIKVCLQLAGLPACFWPYAAVYCALLHNITFGDVPHESPWYRKFGEEFTGKLMPLGCGVWFLPAPTKYAPDKAAPNMSFGIFLGYRMAPGGRWGGGNMFVVTCLTSSTSRSRSMHRAPLTAFGLTIQSRCS